MGLTMKTERPIEDAIQIVEHYISHAVEECECEACDTAYEACDTAYEACDTAI